MRRLRNRLLALPMMLGCLMNLGCSGVTLGPQVRTEYVVLHAGKPVQVLENTTVNARVLNGAGDSVKQDIGGWVAMPMDHWEAVKRNLEK